MKTTSRQKIINKPGQALTVCVCKWTYHIEQIGVLYSIKQTLLKLSLMVHLSMLIHVHFQHNRLGFGVLSAVSVRLSRSLDFKNGFVIGQTIVEYTKIKSNYEIVTLFSIHKISMMTMWKFCRENRDNVLSGLMSGGILTGGKSQRERERERERETL